MNIEDFLSQYRITRNIKRFSMETVISPQDLAGHGYGVANIYALLCKSKYGEVEGEHLFLVMNHDFVETYTGDLNKHIKDRTSDTQESWAIIERETVPVHLRYMTDEDLEGSLGITYHLFMLADALDAWLYTTEEVKKGNSHIAHAQKYYALKCLGMIIALTGEHPDYPLFLKTLESIRSYMEKAQ